MEQVGPWAQTLALALQGAGMGSLRVAAGFAPGKPLPVCRAARPTAPRGLGGSPSLSRGPQRCSRAGSGEESETCWLASGGSVTTGEPAYLHWLVLQLEGGGRGLTCPLWPLPSSWLECQRAKCPEAAGQSRDGRARSACDLEGYSGPSAGL